MSHTRSFIQIFILGGALLTLLSYQYIGAAWTNPPAGAPGSNVDAPINVGTDNQIKLGDITAVHQKAGLQMWSPEYCDENGENCFDVADPNLLPNCSPETFLYKDGDGNWECVGNITEFFPNCATGQVLVKGEPNWVCANL